MMTMTKAMPRDQVTPRKNTADSKSMRGFSLLELLLVITVSALLTTIVIQIFNDFTQRSVNRRAGNHILKIQSSAEEYVAANFTDLWTNNIPNLGDIDEITIPDMIAEGFLPDNYRANNVFRQNTKILIRNGGVGFTGGQAVEVLTVTEDTADGVDRSWANERVMDAARSAGPKVGVIVNAVIGDGTTCCAGSIQSLFGEWSIPLADFAAEFNRTDNPDRGYLAAYGRVAFSDTFNNDYLYRVSIPGQPQVNQMQTNLDMDNNVINGVGVISADNISVGYIYNNATNTWVDQGASLTISGSNTGTGSFTPFALTVDQAMEVAGASKFDFRVIGDASCLITTQDNLPIAGIPAGSVVSVDGSANPATDCEIVGGDFLISGDGTGATTNDFTATRVRVSASDLTAAGSTRSNVVARTVDIVNLSSFTYDAAGNPVDVAVGAPKQIEANFNTVMVNENATTDEFSAFEVQFLGPQFTLDRLQTGSANMVGSNVEAANIVAGRIVGANTTNFADVNVENAVSSTAGVTSNSINASDQFFIGNRTRCDNGCDPIPIP